MALERTKQVDRYSFPSLLNGGQEALDGVAIDESDVALLVHLGKYFGREIANVLRTGMRVKKREYDGEKFVEEKTPFALRNIKDPTERSFVVGNVSSFATTHGCTGGCSWCCYDAFLTADLEVVPLEQKKHFFDELMVVASSVNPDPAFVQSAVREIGLYVDTDPFDDPDIYDLMKYVYSKVGVTPQLSKVVPKRGEENFKKLTEAAARHEVLRKLKAFVDELPMIRSCFSEVGIDDVNKIRVIENERGFIMTLEAFGELLTNIASLDLNTRTLILTANEAVYNNVLRHYNLGLIKDYFVHSAENIAKVQGFVSLVITRLGKFKDLFDLVLNLEVRYGEAFQASGFGDIRMFDFMDTDALEKFIIDESSALCGIPDIGLIRVSLVEHREKTIRNLLSEGSKYRFFCSGRGDNTVNPDDNLKLAGKGFFDSGQEVAGFGIACDNGMKLSPFGLFNVVAGNITHNFPQGKMLVTYKGLRQGNSLANAGESLSTVLENVVLLHGRRFKSFSVPNYVFVYDGDAKIRRIEFNRENFIVMKDEIVEEGVSSLREVAQYKTSWNVDGVDQG